MNEGELDSFKRNLEKEFLVLHESGRDIRAFLYISRSFYTPVMKKVLDKFLMEEAYQKIESGDLTPEIFVVYTDPLLTIRLDKLEQQVDLLNQMLTSFSETQEYEKCSKIHTLLKKITA